MGDALDFRFRGNDGFPAEMLINSEQLREPDHVDNLGEAGHLSPRIRLCLGPIEIGLIRFRVRARRRLANRSEVSLVRSMPSTVSCLVD